MSPTSGRGPLRIVVTDSGLGGLSICAELENRLREAALERPVELIYVNAWPDPTWGYNDLPDPASRARILDKALAAMTGYRPDLILIACNTLSVLYELTEFSREPPVAAQISGNMIPCLRSGTGNHVPGPRPVPVRGIIDEGVKLFEEALIRDPESGLVLFGTRTTIESGEHVRRLAGRGIALERLAGAACHRLAAVIDDDPESPLIAEMIGRCIPSDLPPPGSGGTIYAGLACTHYAYVRGVFEAALARATGRKAEILDPNLRLAGRLADEISSQKLCGATDTDFCHTKSGNEYLVPRLITVEVVSKIELGEAKRRAIGRKIGPVSPRTAEALLGYTRIPDLF